MGLKLLHPQEVEVFYILPALRKEFAKAFKALGWKGTKIAEILGVTEAAISQYFSKKRGNDVPLPVSVKERVANAASKVTDQNQFIYETQQVLDHMLKSKATCDIHRKVGDNIAHDCNTCFERAE